MTKQEYEAIVSRIYDLKSNGRTAVAKRLAEARTKGDLANNPYYDIVRREQAALEMEIIELEKRLDALEIDPAENPNG